MTTWSRLFILTPAALRGRIGSQEAGRGLGGGADAGSGYGELRRDAARVCTGWQRGVDDVNHSQIIHRPSGTTQVVLASHIAATNLVFNSNEAIADYWVTRHHRHDRVVRVK